MRIRKAWPELHGLLEILQCLVKPALFAVECPQIPIRLGGEGRTRQLGELLFCRTKISRTRICRTQRELERDQIRPQVSRLFVAFHRKLEIALLCEGFSLIEMSSERIGRDLQCTINRSDGFVGLLCSNVEYRQVYETFREIRRQRRDLLQKLFRFVELSLIEVNRRNVRVRGVDVRF